ncbi:MAG: h16 [Nevskia sp.]|nr:h16 [Nevskia sp.]
MIRTGLLSRTAVAALLMSSLALAQDPAPASATAPNSSSVQKLAVVVRRPASTPMLAAAIAGTRIVAVGDHGVIILSDDNGKTFRQARAVPTRSLLTSLSFVDAQHGWAAGHDGLILMTQDGGDSWTLQHEDLDGDKPLFAIHFHDAEHGIAVGLFNAALRTEDGGAHWSSFELKPGASEDRHLYGIFTGRGNTLFIAAEGGTIYRSLDAGAHWDEVQTRNPGSFWAGLALNSGALLAVGQRGHVFVSRDNGSSWNEVASQTDQSLTGALQLADGSVLVTGLAGVTLHSGDDGQTFTAAARSDRTPLTVALPNGAGGALLLGGNGIVDAR